MSRPTRSTKPGDSSFPHPKDVLSVGNEPGLTKRETFAAMALRGLIARDPNSPAGKLAGEALTFADALIAALNQEAA